jgi:prepilin-type N-terminal cleavage/methylation domain-containing protein
MNRKNHAATHAPRRGFTLVELLVVIGIIALLISILLPALGRVREKARTVQCASGIRQIYMAVVMYAAENKQFLPRPAYGWDNTGNPLAEKSCAWTMDTWAKANYTAGVIWPFVGGSPEVREKLLYCPSAGDEAAHLGGFIQAPNFSYSMNNNVIADSGGNMKAIRLSSVMRPAEKIIFYEEVAPNDGVCVEPQSNADDFPTGRHGRAKGTYQAQNGGTLEYRNAGLGNHTYFDGHVEAVPPLELINNRTHYAPLTAAGGG